MRLTILVSWLVCISQQVDAAIIDTFVYPMTDQGVSSSRSNGFAPSTLTQNGLPTTDVVGGTRTFSAITVLTPQRNDPIAFVGATMDGAGGDPNFDNTFIAPSHGNGSFVAETQIVWGETTPLNLDIGTDTDFLLILDDVSLSQITLMNATLEVEIETGSGSDSVIVPLLDGGFLQPEYRFSGFTGVDFSDIDRITLTLRAQQNNNSSNFIVSYGAFASAAPVPEPSSALLLGLMAATVFVIRRRKTARQ